HVAARDATRQATYTMILNGAAIPLIMLGGWANLRPATSLLLPVGMLHYSRLVEQKADRAALENLYRSGYDPAALVRFFERLTSLPNKRPGPISRLLLTHPTISSRMREAKRQMQQEFRPRQEYVVDTSGFYMFQCRIAALRAEHSLVPPSPEEN